jgi:phospholipid/cholesterol/gamma-HCH transport system substrate-binding protein
MEAEARYTWVGAAVIALLAALVFGVVWLKNVGGKGDFNRYVIHFEQQALDGLEVGAAVTLRGIKVGRVEDYALASDNLNRVRVEVRIDRRAPAYTNTVAVITRNFVTGIASIALVNDDPPGELLVKVPEGETYPVIGEGRSGLEVIAGRVNKVGEMASVALTNVTELLNAENRNDVMAAVRSLRDLSAGLTERLGTLDTTMQRVGSAATQIGGAVAKIGNTASTFSTAATQVGGAATQLGRSGERVAAVAEHGVLRLDTTLTETERTLAEARRAFAQISAASESLQQQTAATARRLEVSAANVDDQLGATMAELRLSIDTATRVLDRLREPRAALLGPDKTQLGPGETMP